MAPSELHNQADLIQTHRSQSVPKTRKAENVFKHLSKFFTVEDLLKNGAIYCKLLGSIYLDFIERKGYTLNGLFQHLLEFCEHVDHHEIQGQIFTRSMMNITPCVNDANVINLLVSLLWTTGVLQDFFTEVCIPPKTCSPLERKRSYRKLVWLLWSSSWSCVGAEGVRLVDVPMTFGETTIMLAARHRRPDIVLLLLRHDANVQTTWLLFQNAIEVLLFAPNRIELEQCEQVAMKRCLAYFCRAVLAVDMNRLKTLQQEGYCALERNWSSIVPSSRHRHPCALKHLCRYSVRRTLSRNRGSLKTGSMPSAINQLPLPDVIKDYIDLLSD